MNKIVKYILSSIAVMAISITTNATTTTVNTLNGLVSAFSLAMPGDSIILSNGTYNWGEVKLVNTNGSPTSDWIVVKAQTSCGVTFNGTTYIKFSGTRIMLDGFRFADGNAGTNTVIAFLSSTNVFANYSRITNITIDNYNTHSTNDTLENEWVDIYGVHNRVDHSTFINKTNANPTINIVYSEATFPEKSVSTYHQIDSNFFHKRAFFDNGGETIKVGNGNNSRTDGYNIIEHNLFQDCTQKEPEIVSNKSNHNIYRYNTFINCDGGLTLRQGKYCEVYGNSFIVNNTDRTNSYGIRVCDRGHKVYNNYFEGLLGNNNNLEEARGPIVLFNGTWAMSDTMIADGGYLPADECEIAYNTVVNCNGGSGITIGYTQYGVNKYTPVEIKIANNVVKMSKGQAVYIDYTVNPSLSYFAEGNVYDAPDGVGIADSTGFNKITLAFNDRKNGLLSPPENLQDASVNTSAYISLLNNEDIHGRTRTTIYDTGCSESGGTGLIKYYPLDSTMVGSTCTTEATSINNSCSNKNITLYPNPATTQITIERNSTESNVITIYNSTGEIIQKQLLYSKKTSLDISLLTPGIYFFKHAHGTKVFIKRIEK